MNHYIINSFLKSKETKMQYICVDFGTLSGSHLDFSRYIQTSNLYEGDVTISHFLIMRPS